MKTNSELFDFIKFYASKPVLFEPGESKLWDDEYISKSMLDAHLNPNHDAASRKPETIDKTVQHLFASQVLKPGMRVLDLGCGPGLYAQKLCQAGVEVVGLDISERSIDYAKESAAALGLKIQYHCMNFFDMEYINEFDAVLQVYGELCTFSNERRDQLLELVHRALKKDGIFIFDVSTREQRMKAGLKNGWYMSEGGFWRPGTHLVLERGFDYPDENVWLDQYIVIDDQGTKVYRNWFHDYSLDSVTSVLAAAGFKTQYVWNDLTGNRFTEDGDWIAIGAVKEEEDESDVRTHT
ncbi:MAG: methyltransferase domain-containing protein [Clostridia bacterium]|nr:methyltransferase domain-containing protein [Clostridia bacterium]